MEDGFGPAQDQQEKIKVTPEQVVEGLKVNPEDFSLLVEFLNQEEDALDRTSQQDIAFLQLQMTQAEIFRDAGLIEQAQDSFEESLMIAQQRHDSPNLKLDLSEQIAYCQSELDKLAQ